MEKFVARFKKSPAEPVMGAVEREFLPAALEIMKTPPSPLGRMMTWAICAFALVALTWTSLARIDIVAVASGKIITRARTQVVQAPETGIVKSILVEPGQRVKQGEALIQLETETILAEVDHAQTDLAQGRLDEARLRAFIEQPASDEFGALLDIDALQVTRARLQLTAQKLERQSRLSAIDRDRDARRADLQTSELLLRKATFTVYYATAATAGDVTRPFIQESTASPSAGAASTKRMPRPPPPATALIITG